MPRIAIVDQSVGVSPGPSGPRAVGQTFDSAFAQPAAIAAQGLQDLQQAEIYKQRTHDITAVNEMYSTQFSPAIRKLLYDPTDGLMAKQGKDAMDALPQVEKMAETLRTQAASTLQNDVQRRTFDSISRKHLEMEMDGAYRHVSRENQVWQAQTSDAVVGEKLQSSVDHYNDPKFVDGAIGSGLFEIQSYGQQHGQSAEVVLQKSKSFINATRTAIAQRMLANGDATGAQAYVQEHASELAGPHMAALEHQVRQAVMPIDAKTIADGVIKSQVAPKVDSAVQVAAQTSSGFDNAMQFILAKEGGYNASDGNTGAPVNFGINQKANPDIDVKNLTQDGAKAIYKQRYWDAIGGDKLPPATAMMAMDAAVNQGVPFAKKILAESGGDVAKMADMRRAQYQQITANDPTLNRFKGQWLARVDDAQAQASAQPAAAPAPQKSTDLRAGMADMIAEAERQAEAKYPGDPVFRDMAVSQVKGYLNNIVAAQVAQQQQAHGVLINAAMGTGKGSPKPTSLDQLLASPDVRQAFSVQPPESQRGIIALLDHNAKEAIGSPSKDDPAVMSSVFARIHAPDGDPNKITLSSQLAPFFTKGLSREGYDWAKKELDQQQTAGGRSRTKDMELASTSAGAMLNKSMLGSAMPEKAAEAAYRFRIDLAAKVDAFEKAGKDPRVLYTPGNPDYALDPAKVMSYLQTPQQAVAAQAASVAKGRETSGVISGAQAATIAKVSSDAEYEALPKGARFVGPDGKQRVKP